MLILMILAIRVAETTEKIMYTDNSRGMKHLKIPITRVTDKIVIEEAIIISVDRSEQVFGTLMGGVQMLTQTITF